MPYGTFTYRVQKTEIVDDSEVGVVRDVGYERLVLTACHPLYSAAQRYVVFARLSRHRDLRRRAGRAVPGELVAGALRAGRTAIDYGGDTPPEPSSVVVVVVVSVVVVSVVVGSVVVVSVVVGSVVVGSVVAVVVGTLVVGDSLPLSLAITTTAMIRPTMIASSAATR